MNKHIRFFAVFVLTALAFALPSSAFAQLKEAGASASSFGTLLEYQPDTRALHLKKFLQSYGSPLAVVAQTFVNEADTQNVDWKLVAAIAGVESTFGKHVPYNSFNAWGWGIPTGAQSGIAFGSWADGIVTVTNGLKTRYIDRGAVTIEQIGRVYAASPAWPSKVRFFLNKIETFVPVDPSTLEVTL